MNVIAKISDSIKSMLCASSQINSFTKAAQELVFNSIDAEASSIAVRIHIGEGNIQVVDNGCGINKNDFEVLGQNYMTSKLVNITTLKSIPDKYGFRGQSLANIVQVSKYVKITSRNEISEETISKIFEFGKEKQIVKSKNRPSKGTTVEIKGFLYNLSIQKKCSNNLIELQDIKSFLENTSLVHYNVSMSLRDDSTNDIVLKIHKNRDIYQTILNLYDIGEKDVQELRVEKNQYKVIAYIAKRDNVTPKQFIFLNGRLLTGDSEIHEAINRKFSKKVKSRKTEKQKKFYDNQEEFKNDEMPFYVIFIKCPYFDYSLRVISNNVTVDFKDWSEINKLIEKLIQFYNGDNVHIIKEIKNATSNKGSKFILKNKDRNTKDQVKQIMNKIFGSKPKAPVTSQMHNGVKGKQIKRNQKKKPQAKLTISKVDDHKMSIQENLKQTSFDAVLQIKKSKTNFAKHNIITAAGNKSKVKSTKNTVTPKVDTVRMSISKSNIGVKQEKANNKISKKENNNRITKNKNKAKFALHCKFNTPTESIKQRYKILSKEANKFKNKVIPIRRQPKQNMIVQETMQYCKVIENNKNISIRKTMNEVTTYESFPMPPHKLNIDTDNHRVISKKNYLLSTYDILKTLLTQQNNQGEPNNIPNATKPETRHISHNLHLERTNQISGDTPIVTYNSHRYTNRKFVFDNGSSNFKRDKHYSEHDKNFCKPNAFIIKQSMDNFVSMTHGNPNFFFKNKSFRHNYKRNILLKNTLRKTFNNRNLFYLQNNIINTKEQPSYSIQFSESNECNFNSYLNEFHAFDSKLSSIRHNTEESRSAYTLNHTPCVFNLSDNPGLSNYLFLSSDVLQTANNVVKNTVHAHMNEEICITYEKLKNHETYTIDGSICKGYADNIRSHHDDLDSYEKSFNTTYLVDPQNNIKPENRTVNISDSITKVSDKSEPNTQKYIKLITDPIEVCETILESRDTLHNEFETSFNKTAESFHKVGKENNAEIAPDKTELAKSINQEYYDLDIEPVKNDIQTSHHFIASHFIDENFNNKGLANEEHDVVANEKMYNTDANCAECEGNFNIMNDVVNFNLQDRLGFLPKGMSQIFQNSNLKITCDSNSIQEYYNDNIYNEFAHKVQNTVEIFEPKIQEVSDLVTKDIVKINTKIKKDNACLKFNGQSLKNSQVLGQVDEKFIAVIVKGKSNDSETISEFLVLFDQHAVHERIRLETNLADYFTGTEWNAVNLDEVTLKLSPDNVKFLHNYKEKFARLGLQWTILSDNEVALNAIPEAILGKTPRPADKIIKAVQSLIKEVINNVKLQSGCVPLYPKSIMDLVFSEACRYAIKFNDPLSKADCVELIQKLSDCKTPFQCAHGRPVVAVIMDNKPIISSYMIVSLNKIREFKKKLAAESRN